jgi:hypothetical protein
LFSPLESQKLETRIPSWAWWFTPVIPALRRWRQIDGKYKAIMSYRARTCVNPLHAPLPNFSLSEKKSITDLP